MTLNCTTPHTPHRTRSRKSILALSTLALLAGCSSAPPTEDASSSSAAVITSMPFQEIPGATGSDVGSDSLGINWVAKATPTGTNGQEYSWGIGTALAGTAVGGQSGVAIDVGAQGPWVINAAHAIWGWMNGVYQQIPGNATDVGVSPDGNTVYVVGIPGPLPPPYFYVNFPIYKWVNNSFVPVSGVTGVHIDAANDGSAYVVDNTGAVRHITGTPASPVSTYFGPNGTNVTDVTVGADGTVFVVGNNGVGVNAPIYVYDPTANSWDPLPGALGIRVSASSATVVTVVNSAGTIWTTAVTTCGGVLESPCPGNVCGSGMKPDPTLGGTCGYCGGSGEPCCGTTCYAAGTTCGGNSTLNTPPYCVAPCGALGESPCAVNSGSSCQAGTEASGTTCIACGANGQAPCTVGGCASGLVSADNGSTSNHVCVSACGNISQLPCTNGPMGTQNGQWQGGCTQWDAVILAGSNLCQWPTTCGHNGQGCCDAGSEFQGPNSTTDLCHDGSTCNYEGGVGGWPGSWQCGGSTSGGGGGGCTEQDFFFYGICGGECAGLSPVTACTESAALQIAQNEHPSCAVFEGSCPEIQHVVGMSAAPKR